MSSNGSKALTVGIFCASFVVLGIFVWALRRWVKSGAAENALERNLESGVVNGSDSATKPSRPPQVIRAPPPAKLKGYKGGFTRHQFYW